MKISTEIVRLSASQPFKISIFKDLNPHPLHYHKHSYEITLTLGCTGTRIIGDHIGQIEPVDLAMMAPGIPHCWHYGDYDDLSQRKIIVIQFNDQILTKEQLEMDHLKQVQTSLQKATLGISPTGEVKEEIVKIILSVDQENSLSNYSKILRMLDLFGAKYETPNLCSQGYSYYGDKEEDNRFEKVHQYIIERYQQGIKLEDVAELIHLSPAAFSHYFKKRALMSFTNFILELRLGKAAQLLQLTDEAVAQVAFKSGFNNLSLFNRQFKRKYQMNPLAFRRLSTLEANQEAPVV